MNIPTFATKDLTFDFLKKNKQLVIDAKKKSIKHADCISYSLPTEYKKDGAIKALIKDIELPEDIEDVVAKVVINTTNIIDSHGDCHIPGLWKKSLSEMKSMYLLQEHKMQFDKVISDKITAYTKTFDFSALGFEGLAGKTEALIFDAEISKDRNEFMFNQYVSGWVKEHSVGMQYVQLLMCINSTEKRYAEEKANWDKYYPMVANKEVADEEGYFFAVTEAKIIEGSAVLKGSNYATPTITVEIPKNEPSADTQNEAAKALKKKQLFINLIN
jgi:hypothetical protein